MDRKNKVMLIAAIGAVVVLIASSAVRCSVTRQVETVSVTGQQSSQQQSEAEPKGQPDDASAMGILKSHVWQAEGEPKDTCTFTEGSFVESKDGKLAATAFTAGDETPSKGQTSLAITPLREDASGTKASIIISGKEGSYTVSCDAFLLHRTYVQGKAPDVEFAVTGLAEGYTDLIDGKTDELESAIGDWAAKNAPAATKASFDGEVYLDIKAGRVTATFHLNDAAASIVSVAYADGKFAVSG